MIPNRHHWQVLVFTLTVLLAGPFAAHAQPMEIQKIDAPIDELALQPDPDLGGRSGIFTGTTDETGQRYYVMKIDVMSPVSINVLADDPAKPVDVSLHRTVWDRPDEQSRTDAQGNYAFTGRIDDFVGIWLKAEEPSDYHLLVWVGDPVPVEVPPVIYNAGKPVEPAKEE